MVTPVETKQDLLVRLRRHQAELGEMGVSRLGLFGSFKNERQTADSDVDLIVEFSSRDRKTFRNYMALSFRLEEILQRPVELLTKESLSPYIGPHILKEVEDVPLRD